jgi:hypothetical protein
MQLQFNWWAVLVSAVLGMLVPAIWYAPTLFGSAWKSLSGLSDDDLKAQGATYALGALSSLVTAFALAGFLNFTQSQTFMQGALAGIQFWIGFSATQMLVDYRMAKRPWKLTFINMGHGAISMTLMGGILAAWK